MTTAPTDGRVWRQVRPQSRTAYTVWRALGKPSWNTIRRRVTAAARATAAQRGLVAPRPTRSLASRLGALLGGGLKRQQKNRRLV